MFNEEGRFYSYQKYDIRLREVQRFPEILYSPGDPYHEMATITEPISNLDILIPNIFQFPEYNQDTRTYTICFRCNVTEIGQLTGSLLTFYTQSC